MNFELRKFNNVFASRPRAREIRDELVADLATADNVQISFAGVDRVSQSFSDEFLGELLSELGPERICVSEMSLAVRRVLGRAVGRRGFDLDQLELELA